MPRPRLDSAAMSWRRAASLDDALAARPWLELRLEGKPILAGQAEGSWFAVEDRCAHAGCPFSTDGELAGSMLICNCHGSEYALPSGEVQRGPAERDIRSYPVRVNGNDLEIDL